MSKYFPKFCTCVLLVIFTPTVNSGIGNIKKSLPSAKVSYLTAGILYVTVYKNNFNGQYFVIF